MGRRAAFVFAFSAAALAAAAGTAAAARNDVSSNWAGYTVTGAASTSFTHVAASWTQPPATCPGDPTSAAFWVGLGGSGDTSQGLEQAGTAVDCDESGGVTSYAWYELLPAPPVTVKLVVHAGDRVTTSVGVAGTTVTVEIRNLTRGTSFVKQLSMAAPDLSSAEWVAEAPSACSSWGRCRPVPLTNFGKVTFAGASATAGGHTGPIADPQWSATAVRLASGSDRYSRFFARGGASRADAAPGALLAGGRSFTVTWKQAAQAPPDGGWRHRGGGSGSAPPLPPIAA